VHTLTRRVCTLQVAFHSIRVLGDAALQALPAAPRRSVSNAVSDAAIDAALLSIGVSQHVVLTAKAVVAQVRIVRTLQLAAGVAALQSFAGRISIFL
jgi:hypothetical protein